MYLLVKKLFSLEIEDEKEKTSKERIFKNLIEGESYVFFLDVWWLQKDYFNIFKENLN